MEEKKQIKISLGTVICIFIIIVLIAALIGVIVYYNSDKKENVEEIKENKVDNSIVNVAEKETIKEENLEYEELYNKYKDEELYWDFKENRYTKYEWNGKILLIENGKVYLESNGIKEKVDKIKDTAKYITNWGENTLEELYILTEEGTIWKCKVGGYDISTDFKKVDVTEKVIDMTSGNGVLRSLEYGEAPYFLTETGDLINTEGKKYLDNYTINEVVKKISGTWNAKSAYEYDEEGKKVEVGLNIIFGSVFHQIGSTLILNDDGTFDNKMHITESGTSMNGTWYINEIYKGSDLGERNYWVILKYTDGRNDELVVVEDSLGNLRIEFQFSNSYIIMEKE